MSYAQPEHMPLLAKFGHLITVWNDTEYQLRSSLLMMEDPGSFQTNATAEILAAHLGSVQLIQSAKTFANEMLDGAMRDCMLEALLQLDLLRDYRNYYVHGFRAVGWRQDGTPIGQLLTISARGRLTQHDEWCEESDLDRLIGKMEQLRGAFGAILLVHRGGRDALTQEPFTLPELPERVTKLDKSKRYLFEYRT